MPRHSQHVCVLSDSRRVPFSIKERTGDPFLFACFRSPDGRRLERSTKETNRKRAVDAAPALIKEEYEPQVVAPSVKWDEAVAAVERRMRECNTKPRTVEDYTDTLRLIQRLFPDTRGPGDITLALAKEFRSLYQAGYTRRKQRPPKVWQGRGRKPKPPTEPETYTRKSYTVASRLNKCRVVWSKWLIAELSLLTANPWEEVAPPKLDKLTPRYLTGDEVRDVFAWLSERWLGWRLPVLFFTVKGFLGNRIGELCALRTDQLRDGRVVFAADSTKGRKERKAVLPPDVFAELKEQAGATWVWEKFPDQLRERLEARERWSKYVKDFSPDRLKWWLQDELADFNGAHPDRQRVKAHDFRRRAMTEAWKLGIPLEKAAVAFGCNPMTMRAHYIALDETAVADEVLTAIAGTMRAPTVPAPSDVPKAG
ncbi:hypothetical protein R5W24_004183 [Gemmata sp. JC717]|uniref:hypothetical protein n=1 Tax=Gemmata algarum TaxID=2975278 RepID=UPI0021BB2B62|nr:hypothetical protein [Gemmata algarum]MDY3555049.1 hypothetical protein [Gemmata algarum]